MILAVWEKDRCQNYPRFSIWTIGKMEYPLTEIRNTVGESGLGWWWWYQELSFRHARFEMIVKSKAEMVKGLPAASGGAPAWPGIRGKCLLKPSSPELSFPAKSMLNFSIQNFLVPPCSPKGLKKGKEKADWNLHFPEQDPRATWEQAILSPPLRLIFPVSQKADSGSWCWGCQSPRTLSPSWRDTHYNLIHVFELFYRN